MSDKPSVASALALAFLASPWRTEELLVSAERVLGAKPEWLARLVRKMLGRFPSAPRDDLETLRRFIRKSRTLRTAYFRAPRPRVAVLVVAEASMGNTPWPVPTLATSRNLAEWLELTDRELDWLADAKRLNSRTASHALHHYLFRWFPKRRGGHRLLEAPKARLKAVQRRILRQILDRVPAHEAVHGFVPGRSALSLVRAHSGQAVVLRVDLEDFFASVGAARVRRVFRSLGYPDVVARSLTGIVTAVTPTVVLQSAPKLSFIEFRDPNALAARERSKRRLSTPHLPQGAPTSPALANLAAFRLDVRLAHAAQSVGARYGRYADDLTFSGGADFARQVARFEPLVGAIALEEGFHVNHRKTRVMHQGARQRLLGLVANHEPAVSRAEREQLEAILTNAALHGLESQNRDQRPHFLEHLRGRVAWVEQVKPEQANKLRRLLDLCEASSKTQDL